MKKQIFILVLATLLKGKNRREKRTAIVWRRPVRDKICITACPRKNGP